MSCRVIGLGEILWDLLPEGRQLGGAPANFAYHARALGADAGIVSRVRRDALGRAILRRLIKSGLSIELVQFDPAAPTGTVTVALNPAGTPAYTIHENVAWDRLRATPRNRHALAQADAVAFGTLAQRTPAARAAIRELLGYTPPAALRIFDLNLRQKYFSREIVEESLGLANVLKLNDAELPVVAEMFALTGGERAVVAALAARFRLRLVALTRGARGSLLFDGTRWSEATPRPITVVDTVGAGDAFTAALAVGLLRGMKLGALHRAANAVARHVCGCAGATPPLPAALVRPFAAPSAAQ
ncbi:MAG: hypothetical protein RLZZ15_4433 [Verrucomicrobiota bacterium]